MLYINIISAYSLTVLSKTALIQQESNIESGVRFLETIPPHISTLGKIWDTEASLQ